MFDYHTIKNNFEIYEQVKSVLKYERYTEGFIPELSIVIPTYKRMAGLKEAVSSVINQDSYGCDFEIIVVDNEFYDVGDDMLTDLFSKCSNIKYFQNEENIGMFGNWNRCIELASSNWIAMLHDDDIIACDYFKCIKQILAFASTDERIAYIKTNARSKYDRKSYLKDKILLKKRLKLIEYGKFSLSILTPASLGILGAPTCGTLMRRDAIIKGGGYDERHFPCDDAYMPAKLVNLLGLRVFKTIGYLGYYNFDKNASYREDVLRGDAIELISYLEYFKTWGLASEMMYRMFRKEIIWSTYIGIEKLSMESGFIDEKESFLNEIREIMMVKEPGKIGYLFFRLLKKLFVRMLLFCSCYLSFRKYIVKEE